MTDIIGNVATNTTSAAADALSSIAAAPGTVVENMGKDITGTSFYTNPVFYTFVGYLALLMGGYLYMKQGFHHYLFGSNSKLSVTDLLSFPYGVSSPQTIIKTATSNPIILFGVLFTVLYPSVMDANNPGSLPYFYAAIMAIMMIILLFIVHSLLVKWVIKPETIVVGKEFDVHKKNNTYSTLYKGHWVTLFLIAPIYAFTLVYITRKL